MAQDNSSLLCSRCKDPVFTPQIDINSCSTLLLKTGSTVIEMQEAKEMLVLADKDLEYYESETIRLRSQTDHVEAQKNYILDCRIKLRWILSRFRQLPNELLLLIFEFACEWNLLQEHPWLDNIPPSTKIGSSPLSHLPALAITAVCTRWRTLALSSPILWSKIKLELSLQAANNSGFTSILKLYLERSANSPLFLFLDAVGKPRMGKKTDLLPLAQCVHRWSSFTYRGHYAPSRAIPFTSRHFGSLEDLDIELHNNVTGGSAILDLFRIAPKLRSLTTDLTPNCLIDSAHRENELAVLLNSCPNLNTVKLRQQDGLQFKVDFPPHKYHTIHSLTLAVGDHKMARDFMEAVFKCHAFPSLNELHLQTRDEYIFVESAWPKDAFHGFMSRSLCTITSFSVHGLGISDSDFIDILHLLPSLLELSLDDHWVRRDKSPITSNLISHLHVSPSSNSSLLPKLRCLSLNSCNDTFDDAAFVSMVECRWLPDPTYAEVVGVSCLRSLVLHLRSRGVDENVYGPLYHISTMGMRMIITGLE